MDTLDGTTKIPASSVISSLETLKKHAVVSHDSMLAGKTTKSKTPVKAQPSSYSDTLAGVAIGSVIVFIALKYF